MKNAYYAYNNNNNNNIIKKMFVNISHFLYVLKRIVFGLKLLCYDIIYFSLNVSILKKNSLLEIIRLQTLFKCFIT